LHNDYAGKIIPTAPGGVPTLMKLNKETDFPDSQLYATGIDHCRVLSQKPADLIFLKQIRPHLQIEAYYSIPKNIVET